MKAPQKNQAWQRFGALGFFLAGAMAFTAAACSTEAEVVTTGASTVTTLPDGGTQVLAASCTDGVKDDTETDVDCGGSCARCTGNKSCKTGNDCTSTICGAGNKCTFPSAHDGIKNGSETDVDCGGDKSNPRCADGKDCVVGSDCTDLVCTGGACSAASPTDGVKNGDETDVDCGGATQKGSDNAPACAQGKACTYNLDCASQACDPTAKTCVPASAMDGFQDGSETDVDCGGSGGAAACVPGKMCKVAGDCSSDVCAKGICAVPSPTDGVKNGGETDVDCGGSGTAGSDGAPTCGTGKACTAHSDCASDGCDDTGKCALGRSCTQTHGGLSCGSKEDGDPAAVHESCCTALPLTGYSGGSVLLDKYVITAGRLRQFIDRNMGNLRAYVQANPPDGWSSAWDTWMPADYNDMDGDAWGGVYTELGPYVYGQFGAGNQGCEISQYGARTYRLPDNVNATNFSGDTQFYDQAITDEKAINCTPWFIYYAFCAWDGGHLATNDELNYAWGSSTYPWGATPVPAGWGTAYPDANTANATAYSPANGDPTIASYLNNYWWPAEMNAAATDYTIFLPAPGRFDRNIGPYGHMDLAGLGMELTSTISGSGAPPSLTIQWSKAGSWEGHGIGTSNYSFPGTHKYLAATARCAR